MNILFKQFNVNRTHRIHHVRTEETQISYKTKHQLQDNTTFFKNNQNFGVCRVGRLADTGSWRSPPVAKAQPGNLYILLALFNALGRERDSLTGKPQSGSPCRRNSATDTDPDALAL